MQNPSPRTLASGSKARNPAQKPSSRSAVAQTSGRLASQPQALAAQSPQPPTLPEPRCGQCLRCWRALWQHLRPAAAAARSVSAGCGALGLSCTIALPCAVLLQRAYVMIEQRLKSHPLPCMTLNMQGCARFCLPVVSCESSCQWPARLTMVRHSRPQGRRPSLARQPSPICVAEP